VIRHWNRVGPYRLLAVLLLVGAVAGGAVVALDDPDERPASASNNTDAADAEQQRQLAAMAAEHADAERAARSDAQRKADEAAVAAAEQAKKPSPSPSPSKSASPKPSTSPAKPVNIPADCNGYSGNRATGCALLSEFGFGLDQMPCLEKLWTKESGWNHLAKNGGSGAYGIPQSLPGNKMAKFGSDWQTNPATQIRWGLDYIRGRYKTPCGAWAYFQSHNNY
jgi:heat shock protein HslJ